MSEAGKTLHLEARLYIYRRSCKYVKFGAHGMPPLLAPLYIN